MFSSAGKPTEIPIADSWKTIGIEDLALRVVSSMGKLFFIAIDE